MRLHLARQESGQTTVEFALISIALFLLFFGVIDLGRAIYIQATLNTAANEAARVAVRGEPPLYPTPSDVDVENAASQRISDVLLATGCPNGPLPTSLSGIPANKGWLYITEAPAPTSYESSPPVNAPAQGAASSGQTAPTFGMGCNSVNAGGGTSPTNNALQVTIYYNFVPITPLIGNLMANHLYLKAYAVYRTEY